MEDGSSFRLPSSIFHLFCIFAHVNKFFPMIIGK